MKLQRVDRPVVDAVPTTALDVAAVPEELRNRNQWICWRYEPRNGTGKPAKVPVNPHTGHRADITNAENYCTLKNALDAFENNELLAGVGFVFTDADPFVGVDIDDCVDARTGVVDRDAQGTIDLLSSYTEYSPSGTGVHIIVEAALPPGPRRKDKIEIYETKRYFTFTGHRIPNTTLNIEKRQKPLTALYTQIFGQESRSNVAPAAPDQMAIGITLAPNAEPPSEKLKALLQDPDFFKTWNRGRDDMADESPSGYDLALASRAARESWPAQDIADLLIAHRRHHGDDLHLKNTQKYQRTITKALNSTLPKNSGRAGAQLNKRPPESEIATLVASELRESIAWDLETNQWREYEQGLWRALQPVQLQARLQHRLDETYQVSYTAHYLSGVVSLLRGYLQQADWNSDRQLLPFRSGLLNLKTLELLPHRPKNYLTWCLPYEFDACATCEPIKKWFAETMDHRADRAKLLLAVVNAVLKGRVDLQHFIELIGPAATGKSTFITLLEAVVGKENCYATELRQLEKNRFEMAAIADKRLVVITDAEKYAGDTTHLKAITGGDALRIERKHQQQGVAGQPTTKMKGMVVIAANEAIQSADYTSGLQRRRLTIPFTKVVQADKRRDMFSELETYLPGLVNETLKLTDDEVTAFITNTEQSVPSLNDIRLDQLATTNPMYAWFRGRINITGVETDKIYVGVCKKSHGSVLGANAFLYPSYVAYCDETRRSAVSQQRFTGLLEDLVQNSLRAQGVIHTRDRNGSHFKGVTFRADEEGDAGRCDDTGSNLTPCTKSKKTTRSTRRKV